MSWEQSKVVVKVSVTEVTESINFRSNECKSPGDVADAGFLIRVRNNDIATITDVLPRRHVIGGVLEWSGETLSIISWIMGSILSITLHSKLDPIFFDYFIKNSC